MRSCTCLSRRSVRAAKQKFVQRVAGALKFPERLKPRLSWPLWKLFRVMSYPYPVDDAYMAARLLIELAHSHRQEGSPSAATSAPTRA